MVRRGALVASMMSCGAVGLFGASAASAAGYGGVTTQNGSIVDVLAPQPGIVVTGWAADADAAKSPEPRRRGWRGVGARALTPLTAAV